MSFGTIRRSRTYPYPPEMLWHAFTDPAALADWLMPNTFRAEVGHAFTFQTEPRGGFDGTVNARVLALEENRLWHISWQGGGIDTELKVTFTPTATGTRLDLEHSGFRPRDAIARLVLGPGWSRLTKIRLLNTLKGLPHD